MSALLPIFKRLAAYIQEHKVLSEGELRLKIRESLDQLSISERAALAESLSGDVEAQIFTSITSTEKISVFSPDLRTKINYQGEVFYCVPVHGYLAPELEAAFLRWAKLRTPVGTLKDVLQAFLARCGYAIQDEPAEVETQYLTLRAAKADETTPHRLRLFLLPSIKFLPLFMDEHPDMAKLTEPEEDLVIVVPTEKTPAPFISFVREHDMGAAQIWVLDPANGTVNPFIGTPADPEIERNFANPGQARKAVSTWMRKISLLDEP